MHNRTAAAIGECITVRRRRRQEGRRHARAPPAAAAPNSVSNRTTFSALSFGTPPNTRSTTPSVPPREHTVCADSCHTARRYTSHHTAPRTTSDVGVFDSRRVRRGDTRELRRGGGVCTLRPETVTARAREPASMPPRPSAPPTPQGLASQAQLAREQEGSGPSPRAVETGMRHCITGHVSARAA